MYQIVYVYRKCSLIVLIMTRAEFNFGCIENVLLYYPFLKPYTPRLYISYSFNNILFTYISFFVTNNSLVCDLFCALIYVLDILQKSSKRTTC